LGGAAAPPYRWHEGFFHAPLAGGGREFFALCRSGDSHAKPPSRNQKGFSTKANKTNEDKTARLGLLKLRDAQWEEIADS
jgi:hypothetical protein